MIDNIPFSSRRQLTSTIVNADQAEFSALTLCVVAASVGVLDERISESFEDEVSHDINDPLKMQMDRDQQLELLNGEVLEEIARRQHWLGDLYPFKLDGNALVYTPSETGVYEYCLAISQAPNITAFPYVELIRYFEVLAADTFKTYLGSGADYLRTGAPSIEHPKSSQTFQAAMELLHQATEEWVWGPQPEAEPDLGSIKDEGLDFVVWKRLDQRKGALFIVGQCACGKSDWHEKDQDIDANFVKIKRWLSRMTFVPPVRGFALPYPISASLVLSNLTERAGLVMDRLRLTRIAEDEANRAYFFEEHRDRLKHLTQLVLDSN
ncbi:hypothetical protein [Achromobacter mucicolens]|uniref:hypothetical protein n=1 Tax=Achromobacter mucicolens TaxID=1389922 RepID=UPI002448A3A6|nr:hypothetical protein [Achromobacter mucicolens]MDH1522140.1 hypothetical protein [Achromobacter mucicolens]